MKFALGLMTTILLLSTTTLIAQCIPPFKESKVVTVDSIDFPYVNVYFRVVDVNPATPMVNVEESKTKVRDGSKEYSVVAGSHKMVRRPIAPLVLIDGSSSMHMDTIKQIIQGLGCFITKMDYEPEFGANKIGVAAFSHPETGLLVSPWPIFKNVPLPSGQGPMTVFGNVLTLYAEQIVDYIASKDLDFESAIWMAYVCGFIRCQVFRENNPGTAPFLIVVTDGKNDSCDAGGQVTAEMATAMALWSGIPCYTFCTSNPSEDVAKALTAINLASGGAWFKPEDWVSAMRPLDKIIESMSAIHKVTFKTDDLRLVDGSSDNFAKMTKTVQLKLDGAINWGGNGWYMPPLVVNEDEVNSIEVGPPAAMWLSGKQKEFQSIIEGLLEKIRFPSSPFAGKDIEDEDNPQKEKMEEELGLFRSKLQEFISHLEQTFGSVGWNYSFHQEGVSEWSSKRINLVLLPDQQSNSTDEDILVTDRDFGSTIHWPWDTYTTSRKFKTPTTAVTIPENEPAADDVLSPHYRYGVTLAVGSKGAVIDEGRLNTGDFVTAFPIYVRDKTRPNFQFVLTADADASDNYITVVENPVDTEGNKTLSITLSGPSFTPCPNEPIIVTASDEVDLRKEIADNFAFHIREDVRLRVKRALGRDNISLATSKPTDWSTLQNWNRYLRDNSQPLSTVFPGSSKESENEVLQPFPALFYGDYTMPGEPTVGLCWWLEDVLYNDETCLEESYPRVKKSSNDTTLATDRAGSYVFRRENVEMREGWPFIDGEEFHLMLGCRDRAENTVTLRLPIKVLKEEWYVKGLSLENRKVQVSE